MESLTLSPHRERGSGAASDTLYLRNLSDEVTVSDLSSHFSLSPGFLTARLLRSRASGRQPGRSLCAFVEFASPADAEQARDTFQASELVDVRGGVSTLEIEFTRDRRQSRHTGNSGGGDAMRGTGLGGAYAGSAASSEGQKQRAPLGHMLDSTRFTAGGSYGTANASRARLPEGATRSLFVGNLPTDITERELAHVFRPFPGYESIRLARTGERLIAFVSFDSDIAATIAMWTLQGYKLDLRSVGDSRLRIEYSKNRTRRQDRNDRDQDDLSYGEEEFY